MLHVTNGESVSLRDSGLAGEVLAWMDALHEGPVPAGLDTGEPTRLRQVFLDDSGPLAERDRRLERYREHEEVALWFEHDLYDQLQLIQVLDWFRGRHPARLSLICIDEYLGRLTGSQLASLWPHRHAVTPAEMELAAMAWTAFRSPDPARLESLLAGDTSALPFLAGALWRHLQQFPSAENGLARTERQILELVEEGRSDFAGLFRGDQAREERIFMGNTFFARYLEALGGCRYPLLRQEQGRYVTTPAGREVLAGRADHVRLNGINRWLGGVHLYGAEARWRWDERAHRLVPHEAG